MGEYVSCQDIYGHLLQRLYSNFDSLINDQKQSDTIYRIVLLSSMGLIHGTGLNEQAQYDGLLVFCLNHKPDNTVVFLNVLFLMQAISMSVLHISILA